VAPEQTSEELTTLVNIARATGTDFNQLVTDVDRVAPSLMALGYTMDQSALIMGRLNQEVGGPAMARLAFGLGQVEDKLHRQGVTDVAAGWRDAVAVVQQYLAAGDHAAAVDFMKSFVGSARTAETMVDAISKNVGGIATGAQDAVDGMAHLHEPLDDALDATRSLGDSVEALSNQFKAAFADIGVPLVAGLSDAAKHMSTWLAENQDKLIIWGGEVLNAILTVFSHIAIDVGDTLMAAAPAINTFKNFVVEVLKDIDVVIQGHLELLSHLPSWAGGDTFKQLAKDFKDATVPLNALQNLDVAPYLRDMGQGLDNLGHSAAGALGPLSEVVSKGADAAKINEAFSATFGKDGEKPSLQEVLARR
jgi:hypothetical protein